MKDWTRLRIAATESANMDRRLLAAACDVAHTQLGLGETHGKNNFGVHVTKYAQDARHPTGEERQWGPWCAAFASWCIEMASIKLEGFRFWEGRTHSALGLASRFNELELPVYGSLGILRRGQRGSRKGHVFFYVEGDPMGEVTVLDGNIGRYPAPVRLRTYHPEFDPNFVGWFGA